MEITHGRSLAQKREVEYGVWGREIYVVSLSCVLNSVAFPVEGFPERDKTPGRLRENFMYRHWKDQVAILQEGPPPLPQCRNCGMHIP